MKNKAVSITILVLVALLMNNPGVSRSQSMGMEVSGNVAPLLQYQGRLTDPSTGEIVPDGVYAMEIQLFNVQSGGSALWSESKSAAVQKGLFSLVLGDAAPLPSSVFNGQGLWLEIRVKNEVLGPRQPLIPVPYALSLVPGAVVASKTEPLLHLEHVGGGEALRISGDLTVSGSLLGGRHKHTGADINTPALSDAVIPAAIARDSEIMPTVLASDGAGSLLDADLLDGYHANAFALASHLHDDRYFTESESNSLFVNAAGDTMTGNLTVPRVLYSSPRTHYFSVGGEGFQPAHDTAFNNSYDMGGAYLVSGTGAMAAAVHLPQGAVVTAFKVYFNDTSPSSNVSVTLGYVPPASGAYVSLASLDSSGISGYGNKTTISIANPTIDNTTRTYHVRAYSTGWSSTLRVMGALITYTTSEAQ